jgi:hypothetical protein
MIGKLVSMAGVVLVAVGCLTACGGADVAAPDLVAADSDYLTITGTAVRVPGSIAGLGKPTRSAAVKGGAPAHVTFLKPGPLEGTILGSCAISVWADPAANKALAGGQWAAAASAVGQEGRETSVLRAGTHTVLKVARTTVIPGAGLGYPDRVYHDYYFAASDGTSVVSVTTDALSQDQVLDYVAAITA